MTLPGVKIHLKRVSQLRSPKLRKAIAAGLFVGGDIIRVHAQQSIIEGGLPGKLHIPSAPGQPPNADTHTLDRSIVTRAFADQLIVIVAATAGYALFLELGTKNMAARPFMRPATKAKQKEVVKEVAKQIRRVLRSV